jgi:hypothetical protein
MQKGTTKGLIKGDNRGFHQGTNRGNFKGTYSRSVEIPRNYTTSILLNGVSDYLQSPAATNTIIKSVMTGVGKSFSTRFIFKCNSFSNSPWLYSCAGVGVTQGGIFMGCNTSGKISNFIIFKNSSNYLQTVNGPTFSVGVWYDVVFIYDQNAASHTLRPIMYINGILQSMTWVETGTADFIQDTSVGVSYQWGFGNSGTGFFNGNFQEAGTFWNVALTKTDVVQMYGNGNLRYSDLINPGNLVMFCPADFASLNLNTQRLEVFDNFSYAKYIGIAP